MAAFQTVWSVDIGKSSLKAVKMHRERNSLEILAVDKVDFPVESSGIDALTGPKQALETFVNRNDVSGPLVVSHPGHAAFSRFIQLPPVDAKKLEEMIGYEAQQQIPFPIDEVIWDHHVCDSGDAMEKEVGIFAVRKEAISDFLLDYEDAGLSPDHISIGYVGLLDYVRFDLRPQKPSVIIDIGSDHTDLLIVDGERFWVRNLGIAGNDVTQALMDKFSLSFDQAEKLKRTAAQNKEQMAKIFAVVQPVLKELVNEVHRSVGFYKSQAGDVNFEDVYLFGNAAKLIGIQKYLSEHLRYQVHLEKGFHRIRVSRESNISLLKNDFTSFATAVGNGVLALGEGACDVNLLPQERKEELDFKAKQRVVIAAALSLYIVVGFLWFSFNSKTTKAEDARELGDVASEIKKHDDAIGALDGATREALAAETAILRSYGEGRLQPVLALAAIGDVWSGQFDMGAAESATMADDEDKPTRVTELETSAEDRNQSKAWVMSIDVRNIILDGQGNQVDAKARDDESIPTIDGVEVVVVGKMYPQGDNTANNEWVSQRIEAPLEQAIESRTGRATDVQVFVRDSSDPDRLYEANPEFKDRGSIRDRDRSMGEFYTFELKWIQHERDLPKAEEK